MMKVWHFGNGYLSNDRDDKIEVGLSLACDQDKIELCNYGYHGSRRLIDALKCAAGSVLSYCELGGCIVEGDDKAVASIRRHLVVVDVERTLHEFAIWCATQALLLVDEPDPRSLKALKVKQLWLDGKATSAELAATLAAAWDAARDAALAAAWAAALAAARDAARAATLAAAWDAASAAALADASAAARDAARAATLAAAWDAARDAARDAASAAARDAQLAKLEEMIFALPEFVTAKPEEVE